MNKHGKKMIAPIIISILIVLYYGFIAALIFFLGDEIPGIAKVLLVIIPLALSGVMIGVLVSRIKEIRSGEEDDLSNY